MQGQDPGDESQIYIDSLQLTEVENIERAHPSLRHCMRMTLKSNLYRENRGIMNCVKQAEHRQHPGKYD